MRPARPNWLASSTEKLPVLYSFAALSSSSADRQHPHAIELVEDLEQRWTSHFVAHESAGQKRARLRARVRGAERRIGVALGFADVACQSRVERTAVNRVGGAKREVVFVFARNSSRCRCRSPTGSSPDGSRNRSVVCLVSAPAGCRPLARPALPTAERFLDLRERLVDVDVADDDQVRRVWDVVLRNKRAQVGSRVNALIDFSSGTTKLYG